MMAEKGEFVDVESYRIKNGTKIFDVYEPLICKQCNKTFERKSCLKAHIKSHEFDDHTYEAKKKPCSDKHRPHMCNICEKKFTAKKNLLKHLRVIHKNLNEAEKLQVKKTRCPEANCLFACREMRDLRNHIEKYHEIKILKDVLQFPDEAGFLKWKKEEEDNSVASFVSFRRKGVLRNGTIKKVLLCHRTGQYNPKGTGKHRLKSHGSCKIGGTCPAAMEIVQCLDGQITVFYYKTHLGHSQDVIHLQLSREDRAKLSERIKQGFSLDAILEDIKESIDPVTGKTKRIHLLSRKDLYNIIQSSNSKKVKNDSKTGILLKNGINEDEDKTVSDNKISYESSIEQVIADKDTQKFEKEDNIYETGDGIVQAVNSEPQSNALLAKPKCDEIVNKTRSQFLIVSPNVSYQSAAEVILLQPNGTLTNSLLKPPESVLDDENKLLSTERKVPEVICNQEKVKSDYKRDKHFASITKTTTSKSPLMLKLQEKVDKISNFLPKSEYLTPKQYELISRKLDSIINVYSSINVKGKSKKLSLKKISEKREEEERLHESTNSGVECFFTTPHNVVQQQVYEAPLYAYLCNYS